MRLYDAALTRMYDMQRRNVLCERPRYREVVNLPNAGKGRGRVVFNTRHSTERCSVKATEFSVPLCKGLLSILRDGIQNAVERMPN